MRVDVIDGVCPARLVLAAQADWPSADWQGWHVYADGKRASRSVDHAPSSIISVLNHVAESAPLRGDWFPDLSFYAAGLHELPDGVGLDWHKDAAWHPLKPWKRQATAILYLDNGGSLKFRGPTPVDDVVPEPGRVVVFENSEFYDHCVLPAARRRSLAVFFYSVDHGEKGRSQAEFYP